jgi:nucleoside-diphosphate kinase
MIIEYTLSIIKPSAVSNHDIGAIIHRIESNRMEIVALKMIQISKKAAEDFYHEHKGKSFYEPLTEYLSSGPVVVQVLKGDDVIKRYRDLMGATDPKNAMPGTLRYEFGKSIDDNAVHGSDSKQSAKFEINFFFQGEEIFS